MFALLLISFLGLLVSFIAHVFVLLQIDISSSYFALILNVGLFALVFLRLFLTKEIRQKESWFFDSNVKCVCPHWLKRCTDLIVVYGIVVGMCNASVGIGHFLNFR
jgi:hypothetical protein